MASQAYIVQRILDRLGKRSMEVERRVETEIESITVDLLSQNEGRFTALENEQSFTFAADDLKKILPANFNTAGELTEVDSDGLYVAECTLTTRKQVRRDLSTSGAYVGYRKAYIDELPASSSQSAGNYLILAAAPNETKYLLLQYFRKPTGNDTDKIRNWTLIELGVLGRMPVSLWEQAQGYMVAYEQAKLGFTEETDKTAPNRVTLPNPVIVNHNVRQHYIGRGRR